MRTAGRALAVALVLLAAASPTLGFKVNAAPDKGNPTITPLSRVVESLKQSHTDQKIKLAKVKLDMGTWEGNIETLRARVIPAVLSKHTGAREVKRPPATDQDVSEVSADEATADVMSTLKARTPKDAVVSPTKKTLSKPAGVLDSAVTPAGSPEGPPAPFVDDGYAAEKHKAKYVRATAVTRAEVEMPLTGGFQRSASMQDVQAHGGGRAKPLQELVCFLDIDKCSIYGQDGNDLGIAMQWMGKDKAKLVELYRRLLNPQLKKLLNHLRMTVEEVPVVLYTMRPQLLRYKSGCRDKVLNMRYKSEWHHSVDQVKVPPHISEPWEILSQYTGAETLLPGELQDLSMSFQRLLAIRQVVQEELGLEQPPTTVVCAAMKDVQATAQKLGLKPDISYLWDDNEVLKGQPHVLVVPPYVAMDKGSKADLLDFLQAELPASSLSTDVSEFMLGAKEAQRSLWRDGGGTLHYAIHERGMDHSRFPIPELPVHYNTPNFIAMSGGARLGDRTERGFAGALAEVFSATWRKDLDASKDRKIWQDTATMIW